ncbi:MAG TPA: DUF6491 family protein [Gammaproteobacteria bacterium]
MKRAISLAGGVTLALAAGGLLAQEGRAVIHFADIGNIRDWQADGAEALYVQSANRDWYRATFWSPCPALRFATAIAFVTEPNGSLDRYGSILVDGEQCWFRTFERASPPEGEAPQDDEE